MTKYWQIQTGIEPKIDPKGFTSKKGFLELSELKINENWKKNWSKLAESASKLGHEWLKNNEP